METQRTTIICATFYRLFLLNPSLLSFWSWGQRSKASLFSNVVHQSILFGLLCLSSTELQKRERTHLLSDPCSPGFFNSSLMILLMESDEKKKKKKRHTFDCSMRCAILFFSRDLRGPSPSEEFKNSG